MSDGVVRVGMWSGPRNISTAMMRAWENRPDTVVVDEPLYAAYLARTGIDHPVRDQVIASQPTDLAAADRFVAEVDSSAVMVNASTRFNDGGQLGLGAEIGISTDKYHARGPCGLRELTTTKWVVYGDGQVRE